MKYLLYHRSTSLTGKALATALGIRFRGMTPKRDRGIYDVVVRWGSSLEFPARAEINNREGINRAANKWSTLTTLRNAEIPVVPFSRDWAEVCEAPLVYGRSCYGYGGRDLCIYDTARVGGLSALGRHDFFTAGIDVHREYRVHVVGDRVIRVQGKYLEIPEDDTMGGRVCNHANGYRFKTPQKNLNQNRLDDCVRAVKELGLDFGAVDMLLGVDRKHYILEVNTGPSCSPKTLEAYRDALTPLIEERING